LSIGQARERQAVQRGEDGIQSFRVAGSIAASVYVDDGPAFIEDDGIEIEARGKKRVCQLLIVLASDGQEFKASVRLDAISRPAGAMRGSVPCASELRVAAVTRGYSAEIPSACRNPL
jgi:hypothetical protein